MGEKAVRQILNGENTKVTSKWPTSARMLLGDGSLSMSTGSAHSVRKKAILRAFSNDALESYTPVVHEIIRKYINTWCNEPTVLGYQEFRKLTFEISCRILLGFEMDEAEMTRLMEAFETLTANLFSLPICVPGTGLHKVGIVFKICVNMFFEYWIDNIEINPQNYQVNVTEHCKLHVRIHIIMYFY